jgi:hypothetical protein
MNAINYSINQIVNKHNIKYIKEEPCIFDGILKRKRRACTFMCMCGKLFVSRLIDVTSNKRTSCGCKKGNKPKEYKEGDLINGVQLIKSTGTINYAQKAIFKCPICGNNWESLIGNIQAGNTKSCCGIKRGWSRSRWLNLSHTALLYKVRLYNHNESFIKIGMTTKSVDHRMRSIPYKFEVIKVIHGNSGYIYDLENKIKRFRKKYRYKPLINFKGETECYTL